MEAVESGYGYGYGYGSGSGYGDGYGYGYGYGYGSGSGDGDGDGSGYGAYWRSAMRHFVARLAVSQQDRAAVLESSGALLAFWRSDANGCAANNGKNKPVTVGTVEREKGPLRDKCGHGQLHATLSPIKWQGERWWIVALIGERRGDEDKYWALEREILGECL